MHEEQPRYTTLRDYLELLRRQRLLIAAIAAAFALAALGLSLSQSSTYEARASVSFRDVASDLNLLGGQGLPEISPAERAARNAQLVTGDSMARDARRRLESDLSPQTLSGAISARVGVQTNLVEIEASWGDARFAAALANAFAEAAVARATRDEEARLQSAIVSLRRQVRQADPDSLTRQFVLNQLVQLQGIKSLARPAEITQRAEVPTTPTSPRPLRNTVLGALVGLAFGLLAAFARDSLDRRIRNPDAAHQELGLPVVGGIGLAALGSTGMARNGQSLVTPQDLESFRVLRTNLAFLDAEGPPRSVLVTSGLPAEGKSTVAAALASAAAAAGQRTLLVDCDLRAPTLAARLGIKPAPGLTDYLAAEAKPSDILQTRPLALDGGAPNGQPAAVPVTEGKPAAGATPAEGGRDLVCIAAGTPSTQASELLASPRCQDFLDKVTKAYDLVVIDSSPLLAAADPVELLPLVDAVLICVRVSSSTREELRAVRQTLARMPSRPSGIVITGLRGGPHDYYYGYPYGT